MSKYNFNTSIPPINKKFISGRGNVPNSKGTRGTKITGRNTCPRGQHWMPPKDGNPGYCMEGAYHGAIQSIPGETNGDTCDTYSSPNNCENTSGCDWCEPEGIWQDGYCAPAGTCPEGAPSSDCDSLNPGYAPYYCINNNFNWDCIWCGDWTAEGYCANASDGCGYQRGGEVRGFRSSKLETLARAAALDCPTLTQAKGNEIKSVLNRCPNTQAVNALKNQGAQDEQVYGWLWVWCICCIFGACPSECDRCPRAADQDDPKESQTY